MAEYYSVKQKIFHISTSREHCTCKKCNKNIKSGTVRIYKTGSRSKEVFHVVCLFEIFRTHRPSTERVRVISDLSGYQKLSAKVLQKVQWEINECNHFFTNSAKSDKQMNESSSAGSNEDSCLSLDDSSANEACKKNSFREFRLILSEILKCKKPGEKTAIFREHFQDHRVDKHLWIKLLFPAASKCVSKLQTSVLIRIFAELLGIERDTIRLFFQENKCYDLGVAVENLVEKCDAIKPAKKSRLTLFEVEHLSTLTDEAAFLDYLRQIVPKCTPNDLKFLIRLMQHDLRMPAKPELVFKAIGGELFTNYLNYKDIAKTLAHCANKYPIRSRRKFTLARPKKKPVQVMDQPNEPDQPEDLSVPLKRKPSTDGTEDSAMQLNVPAELQQVLNELPTPDDGGLSVQVAEDLLQTFDEVQPQPVENNNIERELFKNIRLLLDEHISKEHEHHWESIELFCNYGGTLLNSEQCQYATHVLHLFDTVHALTVPCSVTAKHIIVEWIRDSIAKQFLQDIRPYTVRWDPIE